MISFGVRLNPGELSGIARRGGFETQPCVQSFLGRRRTRQGRLADGSPVSLAEVIMTGALRSPAFGGGDHAWAVAYACTVVREGCCSHLEGGDPRDGPGAGRIGDDRATDSEGQSTVDEPSVFRRVVEVKTSYVGRCPKRHDRYSSSSSVASPFRSRIVPWWSTARPWRCGVWRNLPRRRTGR